MKEQVNEMPSEMLYEHENSINNRVRINIRMRLYKITQDKILADLCSMEQIYEKWHGMLYSLVTRCKPEVAIGSCDHE